MVPTVNCWQVLPQKQNHQGFRLVTSCSTTRTDRPKAGVPEDKDMLGAAWRVVVSWVWFLAVSDTMGASPWGDFFQRMRLDDHKMSPASQVERVAKRAAAALPQASWRCSEGWMGMEQFFLFQSLKPKDFLVNGNSVF
jgi:hypothetical protein